MIFAPSHCVLSGTQRQKSRERTNAHHCGDLNLETFKKVSMDMIDVDVSESACSPKISITFTPLRTRAPMRVSFVREHPW